jgi:hypothetical protein
LLGFFWDGNLLLLVKMELNRVKKKKKKKKNYKTAIIAQ